MQGKSIRMNGKGLVSIIIPCYNCSDFIIETIESVMKQSYKELELIIIDDFSYDNTVEIINNINDNRIRLFQNDKNYGAAVSRNRAIKKAKGKWIAFLDSDDIWLPDKLEKQLDFMIENDYSFTCTNYEKINANGKKIGKIHKSKQKADYKKVLFYNPVGNSTVMYNVEKIGKVKIPEIQKRNDYALWLKILKSEKYIYGFNEITTQYRVRKNSISSNKIKLIKYQWRLYKDIEKFSFVKSSFLVCWWVFIKFMKIK